MENESYGLEKTHAMLLNALDVIDKICRENGIQYALYAGTMLGAERNHKMIPWDDDADISMTREEYKKFKKIVDKRQDIVYIDTTKLWVPRFIYKDESGSIFVDIFIWDYISEVRWQSFLKINLLRMIQGMMKTEVDYQRYGIVQKMFLLITSMIGKVFSAKIKSKFYQYVSSKCFLGSSKKMHCSNDTYKYIAHIYDGEFMNEYVDIELENRSYKVNKRYKEFLTRCYGENYLTPPPIAERRPAHQGMLESLNKE